ncbi:MAG: 4-phosphoerythronate dehydrogenase [bacterium]
MKIICSGNMPFAREAFSTIGETVVVPDRLICAGAVRDADVLAIRSTVKANEDLLDGSRVKFVGTATIGFDHIDTGYLAARGIQWCTAPGCNANSVSEYIVSALLCLARRYDFRLARRTIGIIGVGHVGGLVAAKARALGMQVLLNDPPRERAEGNSVEQFTPLDKLLKKADVVSLHVPLTHDGVDSTFQMANRKFFRSVKKGALFINCARGPVAEMDVLLDAIDESVVAHAVIDTWDPEPAYPQELLERVDLATPHIAGHSFEGKVMGTLMVYREVCRFLGVAPVWTPDSLMPAPVVPRIVADQSASQCDEELLWNIVSQVYNIEQDDGRLRALNSADPAKRAEHFEQLRRNYPVRREFRYTRVSLKNAGTSLATTVSGLGFKTG